MSNRDALKEDLLKSHDEFRRLYDEHQECERRLDEIRLKSLLSQDDEFEEKRLKRHKLTLKDRMEEILRDHEQARVSA